MALPYTPDERRALERRLARGERVCPRCGTVLEARDVPPRREVSYVRDRIWLVCGGCGASIVLDRRRIERAGEHPPRPPEST
jgi:hypothetical protein